MVNPTRFILSLLLLMITTHVSAQSDLSVGGLKLGMTSKQVSAKLGAYTEHVNPHTIYSGEVSQSVLVGPTSLAPNVLHDMSTIINTHRDAYSLEYVDDHLIFIQHLIYWPKRSESPEFQRTVDDLVEKFGKPLQLNPQGTKLGDPFNSQGVGLSWEWGLDGAVKTKPDQCRLDLSRYSIEGYDVTYAGRTQKNCGLAVSAELSGFRDGSKLIHDLRLSIIDRSKLYAALIQGQQRLQAEKQKEIDKARQNKAPL